MKFFIMIFSLILLVLSISCSKNELKGIVIDGITKEPVDNVSVTLIGTQISGVTNSKGEFNLVDFPIGEHTIKFSRTDYNILETQISLINSGEFFKSVEIYKKLDEKLVESAVMDWVNKYVGEVHLYSGFTPPSGKPYRILEKKQIISKEINDREAEYTVAARFVIKDVPRSGSSYSAVFHFVNSENGWIFKNISREGQTYIKF